MTTLKSMLHHFVILAQQVYQNPNPQNP